MPCAMWGNAFAADGDGRIDAGPLVNAGHEPGRMCRRGSRLRCGHHPRRQCCHPLHPADVPARHWVLGKGGLCKDFINRVH